MKEIKKIIEIRQIKEYDNQIFIQRKNGFVYEWKNSDLTLVIDKEVNLFVKYNNVLFFTVRNETNKIYNLLNNKINVIIETSKDYSVGIVDSNFLINSKLPISITPVDDFVPCGMFLISVDGSKEKYNKYFRYEVKVKNYYFNRLKYEVLAFSENFELIYKKDITEFGRNIVKHPKTGAVLWDKPNEIKEALLADDKNIYVPLTGGQLLALDAETGEKVWMWEHPRSGTFAIQGEYIYKQDGLTVFEIDTKTGELIRKKNFNDDVLVEEFHASGPLWVYDDIIIVCDVLYGKICLLNRQTLEVEEFFSLNNKLVNSKDAIIWNNNKLYVLDIDRTLHIFEKTQNESV